MHARLRYAALATTMLTALTGCASGGSAPADLPARTPAASSTRVRPAADPPVKQPGPKAFVYRLAVDGYTDPTGGQNYPDPASFNALAGAYGAATPPSSALTSSAGTFGGAPGSGVDLTANRIAGTVEISCIFFEYQSGTGYCPAANGATQNGQDVHEFGVVQTWPLYVGDGGSSNQEPGDYTFETTSDDGSWMVLGPAPDTFAQPGDFQGTSGLLAGNALVNNGQIQDPSSRSGSVAIGAQSCANSLYWLTFEYFEVLGGSALMEYSWTPPGTSGPQHVTQSVVWGQVTRGGSGVAGDAVTVTSGSDATTLTTDAGGCFGYNLLPGTGAQKVQVSVLDNGTNYTKSASVANGEVKQIAIKVK